eukprot:CAMPEP_0113621340 /NCGR_PEP_ID=MMETSP0017_2-20120614/10902_1 /TAXON_ID=2856 /ORGANISM="Cylindrotheca closterium" /LENGTH=372 /DNA_ID=CAMNT_0000531077 /DNA_START=106 /DNA_END=1224 /DNA_ORIENTATION=- /assembly_acc=CAM_ASM_000147
MPTLIQEALLDINTSGSDASNQSLSIRSNTTAVNPSQLPLENLLNRRKQCNPGANQPMERVLSFPNYANASSYWNYPSSKDDTEVVCEFDKDRPSAMHFPHAMQQLYGCFSLWQEYPNNRPILLVSGQVEKKLKRNRFLAGIFQLFQSQLEVDVLSKKKYTEGRHDKGEQLKSQRLEISGGYILNQAMQLNHLAANEFQLQNNSTHSCLRNKPRIGILNRRISAGRSIINAELLAITPTIEGRSHNNSVVVEYFEGLDFIEQVSFFRSIDILVAPHGAQLTGVAFMNAPCSHLVELFPKGYAIPDFFGSLAINSGNKYSYVYMSENSLRSEQSASFADRRQARSTNLCPSPSMMASILGELSDSWRTCCEEL